MLRCTGLARDLVQGALPRVGRLVGAVAPPVWRSVATRGARVFGVLDEFSSAARCHSDQATC